jgi:hypothetical protein
MVQNDATALAKVVAEGRKELKDLFAKDAEI